MFSMSNKVVSNRVSLAMISDEKLIWLKEFTKNLA